jgi:hypothetical protein
VLLLSGSPSRRGGLGILSYHPLPGYVVGATGSGTSQMHIDAVRERCQSKNKMMVLLLIRKVDDPFGI